MDKIETITRITTADPELRLIAAQLAAAMEGCKAGNAADCEWINRRGLDYVTIICPAHRNDHDQLARRLLPVKPTQLDMFALDGREAA